MNSPALTDLIFAGKYIWNIMGQNEFKGKTQFNICSKEIVTQSQVAVCLPPVKAPVNFSLFNLITNIGDRQQD